MNPYESPREVGLRQQFNWRLVLLLPAALLFGLTVYQVFMMRVIYKRAETSTRLILPQTFGEHAILAVAFSALALACVIAAFSGRKSAQD